MAKFNRNNIADDSLSLLTSSVAKLIDLLFINKANIKWALGLNFILLIVSLFSIVAPITIFTWKEYLISLVVLGCLSLTTI